MANVVFCNKIRFRFVLVFIETRPYIESLPIVNDCFHYSRRWRDEERNVK